MNKLSEYVKNVNVANREVTFEFCVDIPIMGTALLRTIKEYDENFKCINAVLVSEKMIEDIKTQVFTMVLKSLDIKNDSLESYGAELLKNEYAKLSKSPTEIKIDILKEMIEKYSHLSQEVMKEYEKLAYKDKMFIITDEFKTIVEKLNKYNNIIEALQNELNLIKNKGGKMKRILHEIDMINKKQMEYDLSEFKGIEF